MVMPMHPTLRTREQRARYLILSAVLLALAACAARSEEVTFIVLAIGLALCAGILIVLALRRHDGGPPR